MSTSVDSDAPTIDPAPVCDLVAAFHTSFHVTRGNTLDWSVSIDDEVYGPLLSGVEFNSLPSGLHSVERDVVYFTKGGLDAVAVFSRKKTAPETAQRGYQMEAFGVVLGIEALQDYFNTHSSAGLNASSDHTSNSSTPFVNWESELMLHPQAPHPLFYLAHILRIVGPSFLTIFKCVLARQRVLFYTHAPVEAACLLAKVCVDVAFPDVRPTEPSGDAEGDSPNAQRDDKRPFVLGTVGLIDIDKLEKESQSGHGWVACTTDALFLERPALYDLIVDLTTAMNPLPSPSVTDNVTPATPLRPTLYLSKSSQSSSGSSKPSRKLQQVRFTFSDIRLWNRLDKVLRAEVPSEPPSPQTAKEKDSRWLDFLGWKPYSYEDICILCASIWFRDDTGAVIRLDGDDDALYGKRSGNDQDVPREIIETQPKVSAPNSTPPPRKRRLPRNLSDQSVSSQSSSSSGNSSKSSGSSTSSDTARWKKYDKHPLQVQLTLVLLDMFHSHANYWLDGLQGILDAELSSSNSRSRKSSKKAIVLSPNQVASLRLSSLSDLDSRFLELLASSRFHRNVAVKRGWRDLFAAVVGW
ncbi:hypothetical protein FRB99_007810 [Tulasnella sp. 403]|nr:hypothetical protein FRB99_007810 [Tulasnella sp. 403]